MRLFTCMLIGLLWVGSLFADDRGKFSDEVHIRANTSTSGSDTVMIATTSLIYRGWPTMTIYYKFSDNNVATTLYFESMLQGNMANTQWSITDSLVVSTKSTKWRVWNITDGAIGVTDSWRLRKSVNTDTLSAIFRGFNENFD